MTEPPTGSRRDESPGDPRSSPRFMEIPTFLRAPIIDDLSAFDVAIVGVPYDGAVTNRPGARFGPRGVRNASSMMRTIHPVTRIDPYEQCRVGDAGDVRFSHMYEPEAAHSDIEQFFAGLHAAGVAGLGVGAITRSLCPSCGPSHPRSRSA